MTVDLSYALGGDPEGVKELYDTERQEILNIRAQMLRKHAFRGVTTVKEEDEIKRRFTDEMIGRCAEIGFVVEVEWSWRSEELDEDGNPKHQSPCVSEYADDPNLYWLPRLVFVARTEKLKEFDHDRQKHEIRSGLLDGKAGVIDPNTGLLKEDAKKKNIY